MYAYIKNEKLLLTSDEIFEKKKDETDSTGLAYDRYIETYLDSPRVCYEGGKIIPWEISEEKAREDEKLQAEAEVSWINEKAELRRKIGELTIEISAAQSLDEDTSESLALLDSLKERYASI